jgi:hypothetical protein
MSSHPKKRKGESGGRGERVKRGAKIIYSPWGPEMLKSSPMLRSVYSRVNKPLRKTPSKYKAINRRGKAA